MNGMKINEECTESNGNQRSEVFYSPSHILNLVGAAGTKKLNLESSAERTTNPAKTNNRTHVEQVLNQGVLFSTVQRLTFIYTSTLFCR
jgi:hypothetical protein